MASRDVVIVPYADGPYLVRGPVVMRDQDGVAIEPGRRTVALCRCGKSRIRPFCDGTHQLVRFKAPSQREDSATSAGSRPAASAKRNGSPGSPRLNSPATPPVDAKRDMVASQLRAVQRQLSRALEALEADATQEGELAAVTAQLSALVAMLESGAEGC